MKPTSTSAAISLSQLADLSGNAPCFFSLHRDELPTMHCARVGLNGRPPLCISLADLAEFIIRKTAHLSDAECRLRVSLMAKPSSAPNTKAWRHGTFRLVEQPDGSHIVVPTNIDLNSLPTDVRIAVEEATAKHNAECKARHEARRRTRSTSQGVQS